MTAAAPTRRSSLLRFGRRRVARIAKNDPYRRAVSLTGAVCAMAGSMSLISDIETELTQAGVIDAISAGETPPIFDWLLTTFSYQGVSDQAARTYMKTHGTASWSQIEASLKGDCACPKLRSYWHDEGCKYSKSHSTCAEPHLLTQCPLPQFRLRNGRLNQLAYSFFLFVRDVAGGDLVGWIDSRLGTARATTERSSIAARQDALINPLAHVHGVADKILNMALANLLIGAGSAKPIWFETGTAMIAVDTLVHAFFHRTGILQGCGRPHLYGPACYAPGGCADIIRELAGRIDARTFNPKFPAYFPRFIQHAIWRYCAADGLNICNGVKINDRLGCRDAYCRLGSKCDRNRLKM